MVKAKQEQPIQQAAPNRTLYTTTHLHTWVWRCYSTKLMKLNDCVQWSLSYIKLQMSAFLFVSADIRHVQMIKVVLYRCRLENFNNLKQMHKVRYEKFWLWSAAWSHLIYINLHWRSPWDFTNSWILWFLCCVSYYKNPDSKQNGHEKSLYDCTENSECISLTMFAVMYLISSRPVQIHTVNMYSVYLCC